MVKISSIIAIGIIGLVGYLIFKPSSNNSDFIPTANLRFENTKMASPIVNSSVQVSKKPLSIKDENRIKTSVLNFPKTQQSKTPISNAGIAVRGLMTGVYTLETLPEFYKPYLRRAASKAPSLYGQFEGI